MHASVMTLASGPSGASTAWGRALRHSEALAEPRFQARRRALIGCCGGCGGAAAVRCGPADAPGWPNRMTLTLDAACGGGRMEAMGVLGGGGWRGQQPLMWRHRARLLARDPPRPQGPPPPTTRPFLRAAREAPACRACHQLCHQRSIHPIAPYLTQIHRGSRRARAIAGGERAHPDGRSGGRCDVAVTDRRCSASLRWAHLCVREFCGAPPQSGDPPRRLLRPCSGSNLRGLATIARLRS